MALALLLRFLGYRNTADNVRGICEKKSFGGLPRPTVARMTISQMIKVARIPGRILSKKITFVNKMIPSVTLVALFSLLLSQQALASHSATFSYDSLGRLVIADDRGTSGTGHRAGYILDQAGNRLAYKSYVYVRSVILPSGTSLSVGQGIVSDNLGYSLVLQDDGNLVQYGGATEALWATMTSNSINAELVMQADGNLVLYEGGQAVWASGTAGHPGAYFALQADGNLVVYASGGQPLWAKFGL